MILRILIAVGVCIFVIFLAFWLLTGGIGRGIEAARGIDGPLSFLTGSTTGGLIRLPWQPDELVPMINIAEEDYGPYYTGGTQEQLNDLQDQYEQLSEKARDSKTFGEPSPHQGEVTFGYGQATDSNPATEYLELNAGYNNTAPVSMAGWSLQSAVTGIRFAIPQAAPTFILGTLNAVNAVTLNPGGRAMIVSGPSPVGISFRENICSGYLNELQHFDPLLEMSCPSVESAATSLEAMQAFGEGCYDYVHSIEQCHFPGKDAAPGVSVECRNFASNSFSYNGCVNTHRSDRDFLNGTWRLYLTSAVELWRNSHDVVRLLDENGRTVDVLTY